MTRTGLRIPCPVTRAAPTRVAGGGFDRSAQMFFPGQLVRVNRAREERGSVSHGHAASGAMASARPLSRPDRDRKLACRSGNRAARDDDKDGRAVVDWLRAKGGSKSELERFFDLLASTAIPKAFPQAAEATLPGCSTRVRKRLRGGSTRVRKWPKWKLIATLDALIDEEAIEDGDAEALAIADREEARGEMRGGRSTATRCVPGSVCWPNGRDRQRRSREAHPEDSRPASR
jgi:hypothetical protein